MLGFNWASMAVFASLGLVALALGLLARAYSGRVLAVGLAGLFGVTAASAWIAQAGPEVDNSAVRRLTRENIELTRVIIGLVRAVVIARTTPLKPSSVSVPNPSGLGPLTLGAAPTPTPVAPTGPTPVPEKPPSQPNISDILLIRLGNPFYSVQPLNAPELVKGLKGKWYLVQLRVTGNPLDFPASKSDMPGVVEGKALQESARKFREDILEPLGRAKSVQLFVRGSADNRTAEGERVEIAAGENLHVLKPVSNADHSFNDKTDPAGKRPANDHLPNLRADWLRKTINDVFKTFPLANIQILDNPPQPGHGRTADLILFVPQGLPGSR
jgi:hypothetical protein